MQPSYIPYGTQDISEEDILAVETVLRSAMLTQGPCVPEFEAAVAARCNARHAVAVNSATSALHLACMALDVGPGDTVWTSPVTFVASANAALYCGASVDFVDIDPNTYNLCPVRLAEKLESAAKLGRLPKVVIPVHLTGQPCDMPAISAACRSFGVAVIEDASHAIGAHFDSAPVGACIHSEIAVFSYHPVKIVTTGEGGMALTNDDGLAERLRLDRSHGITREPDKMAHEPDGDWYYEQIRLGYNYRITDVAAALGLSQLSRLDAFLGRRREIAARYDRTLGTLPVKTPYEDPRARSAWHLYVVRIDPTHDRRCVFDALRAEGIGVNVHYIPVYRQPWYSRMGFDPEDYPNAEAYYAQAISLPIHPRLSEDDQSRVEQGLARALCP